MFTFTSVLSAFFGCIVIFIAVVSANLVSMWLLDGFNDPADDDTTDYYTDEEN